jgi:hypothetical protein
MKEKLLRLLENDPATAGRPSDFLDTLAEDIQAVIIRAIAPGQTEDEVAALEAAVEEVYHSDFGISFFNLYGIADFPGKKNISFAARKQLVRAALQTILLEQAASPVGVPFLTEYSDVPPTDGPTLKRRLKEMAVKVPSPAIN